MNVAKLAAACGLALVLAGCAMDDRQRTAQPSAATAGGEASFNSHCAVCHGIRAIGTEQGPPLVHKIYEPAHHSDAAFLMAVQLGVKQHHWRFGDMPRQPQVMEDEARQIVTYVRTLQREAGIE